MKTLDEVISTMEYEQVYNGGEARDYDADALRYLKKYRAKEKEYEHLKKVCFGFVGEKMAEMESNDPLDWETLKQMEGKPVWVELPKSSRRAWGLSDGIFVDAFYHDIVTIKVLHDLWHLDKEQMGKTWQAYRKERE